ncbi:heavy-metal-associated domain-containing protein [Vermiphilus pyriformis]|jgi:hypothetical protein|nr:MAG: heavy-metal-associated domain-containing protein [Vermiphilus pyriformis]
MNHNNIVHDKIYTLKNFLPLMTIGTLIILFTITKQIIYGFDVLSAMYDFMGSFFIIFSIFKIINLHGFVQAYSNYDIIAMRSIYYAYIYPFIEFVLGVLYLIRFQLTLANYITLVLMTVNSIGVGYKLAHREQIICACLGTVFKVPMTYVTLAEDIIMGTMALIMLFK